MHSVTGTSPSGTRAAGGLADLDSHVSEQESQRKREEDESCTCTFDENKQ
ncbi:conserved hypothetical protein [Ricinus communis]|uniref:Uncharacterized protein n=1 Tax=Ricinus communis TaxID=3988 RepID=B9R9H1_RICCO|nr:conserved hypothetical protein [Ricinus communis]